MEASNEFRRREPTLLAIFSCQRAGCYRISLRDAAMTEKSYQPSRESAECRMNSNLNKSSSQTTAKRPSAMQQKHRDDNQKTFPAASRYPHTAPRKNVNPQEVSNEDPIAGRHGSGAGGKQSDTGGRGSSGENPRAAIAGMRKR